MAWCVPRQLCEPLGLATQEGPEAEPVVEVAECRQIRQLTAQRAGARPQRQVAGDAREAAGQVHRFPMGGEARAECGRTAQRQIGDAPEVRVQLIE